MSFAKFAFLLVLVCSIPVFHAYGQLDDKPAQGVMRSGIVGVKLLDAYFGTSTEKMEVGPGDKNVPFTVEFANISTTDIVGIKGQLSVPTYFHSPQGINYPILADSNARATMGSNFHLTFYLDISDGALVKTYPGSVKLDIDSKNGEVQVLSEVVDEQFQAFKALEIITAIGQIGRAHV